MSFSRAKLMRFNDTRGCLWSISTPGSSFKSRATLHADQVAIEASLSKTKSELSALQKKYDAVRSKLETAEMSNAHMKDQLSKQLDMISGLQTSQKYTLKALQDMSTNFKSSLNELKTLKAKCATLAVSRKNLCRTRDSMAETIVELERRAKQYVIMYQDLKRENLQLQEDLRGIADGTRPWRVNCDLLQTREEPFQEICRLREQVLKQTRHMQELEAEVVRLSCKTMPGPQLKENIKP
ncbi:myosin-4-like isoform X5 [Ixodes scapularis]|uniref:myosin-4-like isoform X5 n=1 Tax=Ixodes scapularis TaxID=6945 RepID=UPI0011617F6B|nr:myosin-4-like isoform X5 [Ixodes scapularis]